MSENGQASTIMSDEETLAAARATARRVADQLAVSGAEAVCAVGSVARGDAHAASDIDLVAIGGGLAYHLEQADGRLVTVSWRTAADIRAAFRSPPDVGSAVPAWRSAVLLHDPNGVASGLQSEARYWSWADIATACDEWIGQEVTGFAEEVHRLVGHLSRGWARPAAATRAVLALRLAFVMAVRHRILYDSENFVWDLVAQRAGTAWAEAQDLAMAVTPATEAEMSRAALRMYEMTAESSSRLLNPKQNKVVSSAIELIQRLWVPPGMNGARS